MTTHKVVLVPLEKYRMLNERMQKPSPRDVIQQNATQVRKIEPTPVQEEENDLTTEGLTDSYPEHVPSLAISPAQEMSMGRRRISVKPPKRLSWLRL